MLSRCVGTYWSRVTESLIFHLRQQPFGRIRVRRSQHHCHEGASAFYHMSTGYSPEIGLLLHGDLWRRVIENRHPHLALGAVENSQLGLRAVVEGGDGGRNCGIELCQAGRSDDVAFAVRHRSWVGR